jgi:hypothetical protein
VRTAGRTDDLLIFSSESSSDSLASSERTTREWFNQAWNQRVRRLGNDPREPAWQEFKRLVEQEGVDPQAIIAAEMREAAAAQFASRKEQRFIPQFVTRLRNRQFESNEPTHYEGEHSFATLAQNLRCNVEEQEQREAAASERAHADATQCRARADEWQRGNGHWQRVLDRLEDELTPKEMAYVADLRFVSIRGPVVTLAANAPIVQAKAMDRKCDLLASWREEVPEISDVRIVLETAGRSGREARIKE